LYESNDAIIDNPLEFSIDVVSHFLCFFFLNGTNSHGLDEDLVGYGNDSQASPGSTIIDSFLDENILAGLNSLIVL
jgi:hypothetical protein